MKLVVLCGGLGTRLREETEVRPKPMVEIGGRPILWHIMKLYATHGIHDFVLCLGYKGPMIRDFFLNYECRMRDLTVTLGTAGATEFHTHHNEQDWRVTLVDTGATAQTGARVRRVRRHIEDGTTFQDFFGDATLNPKASAITGVVCGVRVQDIEDPLMREIRYLDKLVDELAKGKTMEKILRA